MKFLLIAIFVFCGGISQSAPIPLTSSSLFISAQHGLFHSPIGFSIHSGQTGWTQNPSPKNNPYIGTVYRASLDDNVQAALTVRVDKVKEPTDLSTYSQKWMKDYPRFGFDILAAKKVRVGNEIAFMLDLVHRDNLKQLRQVLFVRNKTAVSLTCRDDVKSFSKTLKSCNEIIRTFRW